MRSMTNTNKHDEFSNIKEILGASAVSSMHSGLSGPSTAEKTIERKKEIKVEEQVSVNKSPQEKRQALLKKMIKEASNMLREASKLLNNEGQTTIIDTESFSSTTNIEDEEPLQGTLLEGVFDGEKMVGDDGKRYFVPPNYASKSKLVEGDMMKLTITKRGAFVYKQIGPIERDRLKGELVFNNSTKEWGVRVNNTLYRILTASVTFHKGNPGDEVAILVPKDSPSKWAAVEHILQSI